MKKVKRKKLKKHQIIPKRLFFFIFGILLIITFPVLFFVKRPSSAVLGQSSGGSIPAFSHIFVIMYENHSYSQIIGNPAAPYINKLAGQYGSATNFLAIGHPSLPNYIALTSGGTQGITNDCNTCFLSNVVNIFGTLETAGKTWTSYLETMPSNCYLQDSGAYVLHHNPAAYYLPLRSSCSKNDIPYSHFAADLTAGNTGNFTFIVPNNSDNMHSGSIQAGDTWLSHELPQILASSAFQNNGVVFFTFDEGDDTLSPNQIVTLVISPLAKTGFTSSVSYNLYSLLRTIAEGSGVTAPGSAAQANPMSDFFSSSSTPSSVPPTQPVLTGASQPPTAPPTNTPPTTGPTQKNPSPSQNPPHPTTQPCISVTNTPGQGANVGTFNPDELQKGTKPCKNLVKGKDKDKSETEKDTDNDKKTIKKSNGKDDSGNDKDDKKTSKPSFIQSLFSFFTNLFK